MQVGDILDLRIEKLNSEGAGIARVDGFVLFVKNSCPDDILRCKVTKLNKRYGFAEIVEILTPSVDRVEPKCKMYKLCGACSLQHISYEAQLRYKKQIVEDTLFSGLGLNINVGEVVGIPDGFNYRNKIQYPVGSKKGQTRILAGYYQQATHELINIKYCPIQPDAVNDVMEFIKLNAEKYGISAYDEKKYSGLLRHIVIRVSEYDSKMIVSLVLNAVNIDGAVKKLAQDLYDNFDCVVGISANFNTQKSNVILGNKSQLLFGQDYVEEKLSGVVFKISADTFFQVNPKCANLMFDYVKTKISEIVSNPTIFDAYAGIAAFGIVMSDIAKAVVSVELNEQSILKAKENLQRLEIHNVEAIASDTMKYLENEGRHFDVTIIDPPRKGSDETSLSKIAEITDKLLVYVSCNPATLARDLKLLLSKGFEIESVKPFDMFPQTPHVETVVVLKKKDNNF